LTNIIFSDTSVTIRFYFRIKKKNFLFFDVDRVQNCNFVNDIMSSFNITLYCLIYGDNITAAFPVKVDNDKTIGELKKIIKDENTNEFSGVDAKDLTLWKVEILENDNDNDDDNEIKQIILQDIEKTKLLGIRYIEDYWTDSPPKRCIHVIVEPPIINGELVKS
jgi:hypothetical protein